MKTKKKWMSLLGFCLAFLMAMPVYAAANVATLSWSLIDSGKHLDWGGSTAYQTEFNAAINTWNSYKAGVIRKDSWNTIKDVTISDYSEVSSVVGVTSSAGTIKFNTYNMQNLTSTERLNTCTHELGHALGLAHNQVGDVMYAYVSTVTNLSDNDKASYDASYNR